MRSCKFAQETRRISQSIGFAISQVEQWVAIRKINFVVYNSTQIILHNYMVMNI